jgi:hypothetical protein
LYPQGDWSDKEKIFIVEVLAWNPGVRKMSSMGVISNKPKRPLTKSGARKDLKFEMITLWKRNTKIVTSTGTIKISARYALKDIASEIAERTRSHGFLRDLKKSRDPSNRKNRATLVS